MQGTTATSRFLYGLATLQLLTAGIAIMPTGWIEAWHKWLGLGPMPYDPLLLYAVRGGGFVQGAIGVLLWIMAGDVVRFRPLIVAVAVIFLVSSPAFYLIDSVVGLPLLWCLLDAGSCFAVGGILLALCLYKSLNRRLSLT
jgi:hypothetical protein